MLDVLVVMACHYKNWERTGPDDIDVLDEEDLALNLVGVFTTVRDAADACYTFIQDFEADEEGDGPIAEVRVYGAKMGTIHSGRLLCELPQNGNRKDFEAKITQAMETG